GRERDAEVLVTAIGRRIGALAHVDVRRADGDREPIGPPQRLELPPTEDPPVEVEHALSVLAGEGAGRDTHPDVAQHLRSRHRVGLRLFEPDSGYAVSGACGDEARRVETRPMWRVGLFDLLHRRRRVLLSVIAASR